MLIDFETIQEAQDYLGEDFTRSEAWELVSLLEFYNEVWF
jgi:hypothetical protein